METNAAAVKSPVKDLYRRIMSTMLKRMEARRGH